MFIISIIFSIYLVFHKKFIQSAIILTQVIPIIFLSNTIYLYNKLEIIGFRYKVLNDKNYKENCLKSKKSFYINKNIKLNFCEIIYPVFREVYHYIYYDNSGQKTIEYNSTSISWNKIMLSLNGGNTVLIRNIPVKSLGYGFYDVSIDLQDGDLNDLQDGDLN